MGNAVSIAALHLKKQAFVQAYAECGIVTVAAKAADISRPTYYAWLKDDPEFKLACEAAEQAAADSLESEARRRATVGVTEPVYYQGDVCGEVQKYSDVLLIFLLKGAKPAKYRERFEHSGPGGTPLQVTAQVYVPHNGRDPISEQPKLGEVVKDAQIAAPEDDTPEPHDLPPDPA